MQDFLRSMVKSVRCLGGIAFNQSIMKQVFLVFMLTVSLSRAIELDNSFTLSASCDNSTMHLRVNFTNTFRGTVFQTDYFYYLKCSYTVPVDVNVTEVELSMQYDDCDINIEELENRTIASTAVTIQMHNLLDSVYDKNVNVSCEIDNFHIFNETESEDDNQFSGRGVEHSWIEFQNGLVLFGEVGEPIESTLYFVVYTRDGGFSKDMIVRNCIAHTDKNITSDTTMVQLSNFYGCPDPSDIVANFTVRRPRTHPVSMFAYAPLANFSLIASGGSVSVTCGITLCENACPAHCNDTRSPIHLPLSDFATKDIVTRGDGAIMPNSLQDLNEHNDRSKRMLNRSKRSLGSFFSSIFHWESQIITGSVSKGNVTNVTSTGMTKGLLVKKAVSAKDVLAFPKNRFNVNLTKSDSKVKDEFCVDWYTLRFIFLMTICIYITVVACYCCYSNGRKMSKGPFVF